jgi:two-component system, NarL family, sensor histidine kinase UhpB
MAAEVEEAGGTVAIASDPESGTAVTITIPLD